jgi:hypothetical protein
MQQKGIVLGEPASPCIVYAHAMPKRLQMLSPRNMPRTICPYANVQNPIVDAVASAQQGEAVNGRALLDCGAPRVVVVTF